MTDAFDGCFAKLSRARHHLMELQALEKSELAAGRIGVGEPISLADGTQEFYSVLEPASALQAGLVIGDIFHNARTALDHLVVQLAKTNGSQPSERSAFPICKSGKEFRNSAKPLDNPTKTLFGISNFSFQLIESVQPFKNETGIDSDPFWHVGTYDNFDKHRIVTTVNQGLTLQSIEMNPPALPNYQNSISSHSANTDSGFSTGEPIGSGSLVRTNNPEQRRDQADVVYTVEFAFADGPAIGRKVSSVAEKAINRIEELVHEAISIATQIEDDE